MVVRHGMVTVCHYERWETSRPHALDFDSSDSFLTTWDRFSRMCTYDQRDEFGTVAHLKICVADGWLGKRQFFTEGEFLTMVTDGVIEYRKWEVDTSGWIGRIELIVSWMREWKHTHRNFCRFFKHFLPYPVPFACFVVFELTLAETVASSRDLRESMIALENRGSGSILRKRKMYIRWRGIFKHSSSERASERTSVQVDSLRRTNSQEQSEAKMSKPVLSEKSLGATYHAPSHVFFKCRYERLTGNTKKTTATPESSDDDDERTNIRSTTDFREKTTRTGHWSYPTWDQLTKSTCRQRATARRDQNDDEKRTY